MQRRIEFYLFFRDLDHSYQQTDMPIHSLFLLESQPSLNTEMWLSNHFADYRDRYSRISPTQNVTCSGSLGGKVEARLDQGFI